VILKINMNFVENENKILEFWMSQGLDKDFCFGRMELLKPTALLCFSKRRQFFYE